MRHYLNLILPMRVLNSTQKVMLLDVLHNEENQFTAKDCYTRLQIDKHTYNKQLRNLVDRKLVNRVSRFEYQLNIDIF